jgi:phosphoglycolate phosphatase
VCDLKTNLSVRICLTLYYALNNKPFFIPQINEAMSGETTIIWDWNGTLLNDVKIATDTMNSLLDRYGLPKLTKTRYREIFQFPVENYYIYAGFSFDQVPFSTLAEEFITQYYILLPEADLFAGVIATLSQFRARGYRQYVLSAMEQSALEKSINNQNTTKYFDGIYGISNIYGRSKLSRGQHLFEKEKLRLEDSLLIGDTIHDFHLATQIGCDHLLIAQGHQNFSRLRSVTSNILPDIIEIPSYLFRCYPKRKMSRYMETISMN